MNVKYRSYHTYRESGSSLLGEVPHDWRVARIAHVFVTANAGEVIDKGFWGDGDELLYTCKRTPMKSDYSAFPDRKRTVQNDLLLTRNGTPYVHKPIENSIYSNVVQRITLSKQYSRNYLAYCLGNSALGMRGYGVSIESFNFDNWKSLRFTHPDLYEQTQIAKFLDYETAKIDALIEKQQQLIALLKEKRQAVISHAVTKGLNPDAPMRDSGVEWLGEVPAHWIVCALKRDIGVQGGYAFRSDDFGTLGEPVIRIGDIDLSGGVAVQSCKRVPPGIAAPLGMFVVCEGDIVMAMTGATIGKCGRVPAGEEALLNQRVGVFRGISTRLTYEFLWFILQSEGYVEHVTLTAEGGAQPNISDKGMLTYQFALPTTNEQLEIVEYFSRIMPALDSLDRSCRSAMNLLQERRTALISAAVTGKIDVRDWVSPEPRTEVAAA